MLFEDRIDAGRRLAATLAAYRSRRPVVLALPRGGVPVAAEIARSLAAPLDLLLVRKIGLPGHSELAIGAVVDGAAPLIVRNEALIRSAHVGEEAFQHVCRDELAEIERRRTRYLGGRTPVPVAGRVAIVVDDGIATGATVKAALRALRRREPAELVLAVPVAPAEAVAALRREVDALVCLATPEPFGAIGRFYEDFGQLSDAEVIAILAQFPAEARPPET
ncbi:phosphoribosyltransferase [Ancylobacter oerskovii]|uniref:Phosphoribosyltransferase n=1 Tax=Ancylobacter oerskovii TaxID=459519 RepID=A0ABW4YU36_9HYPH|nr:phosphoribosyltransferase family protein [Ancylobacter oerskovii]MBS7543637.1 phosphoribosyltransferase [Ancylobacter oerskovii]